MEQQPFLLQVKELLKKKDIKGVRDLLKNMHAADIATLLYSLDPEETMTLFRFLHKDVAAEVFSYLDPTDQVRLINIFEEGEAVDLVSRLEVDDAVDLLEELPANVVNRILVHTPDRDKRDQLNRFMKYEEGTAGSVMSPEYIKIYPLMTVDEAIDNIRTNKERLASYSQIYVTSKDLKLLGVMSIRELLTAENDQKIVDVMRPQVISVNTFTNQEDALKMIQKYDFHALPVTDLEDRLVGIITVDDALDIYTEETSKDVSMMAAVHPTDKKYFDISIWDHVKARIPWLVILMLAGLFTGQILGQFEAAFTAVPILVTFIPVLTDTGGNSGAQSSTMIIRGMAVGDLETKDLGQVIWKEFRIALSIGGILSGLILACILIFPPHDIWVGLVVALAMLCIVVMAKLLGALLPIFFQRIGVDPALMASPLITTLVDAGGLVVFFKLAQSLLKL